MANITIEGAVGVHLELGLFNVCGYVYPTGRYVNEYSVFPIDSIREYRCAGCGKVFDSTAFADKDVLRTFDNLENVKFKQL